MSTATVPALATPADVLRLIGGAGILALDLETTGLNPLTDRARLCSLSDGRRTLVIDCFEHDPRQWVQALKGKILICHNALFDLSFLWVLGLTDLPETVDTYLLAQLLHAGEGFDGRGFYSSSLASCAQRYLDKELSKDLQSSDWSGPLSAEQIEYSRNDAEVLTQLLPAMEKAINAARLEKAADIELRALPAFVWLSMSGCPFDRDAWLGLARQAAIQKQALGEQLHDQAPQKGADGLFGPIEHWNWDSPEQVKRVLSQVLKIELQTTADAQLALLEHPLADLIREYRHQATLLKMYGSNWLADARIVNGRVYAEWLQYGTVTGRTSCRNPNLQQIPRDEEDGKKTYRLPFRAGPGKVLVKADYATLQMRIACLLARDEAMGSVFLAGEDVHTATAQRTLGKKDVSKADRQIAKSQNFGLLFGMSAEGLRVYAKATYGVSFTKAEAERHRSAFFAAYPGLARWHAQTRAGRVKETRSVAGRRRLLSPNTPDTERLNSPVQGVEADGAKAALSLLWRRRSECPSAKPVLFAHDEIVIEVDQGEAEGAKRWLEEAMIGGMQPHLKPVPVRVDGKICRAWGE